jgi:hypothetical protein
MTSIKIYKIVSECAGKCYIGSTLSPLNTRLRRHRADYKRFQSGLRPNITSFEIIKHDDAKIELVLECDKENREIEEKRIQDETENCVNRYDPTKYHVGERKKYDTPDNFTDEQLEKIKNTPNYNAKCVLRNYYRKREEKLRLCALRRIRLKGEIPKDTTLEKYNISMSDVRLALKEFSKN